MSIREAVILSFLSCSSILSLAEDFPQPFNTEKGDPMPAEEVARTMELPQGFKCVVFAAEPDVQQPIAMAWDTKGRLWVAENYTYAENPKRWDTSLRDRIIILEDKDGDGKHDGRKVFWQGGSYLTSVETGFGGVWVLHNGTLSFIADKNGDDVPDGEPEVLLDGFNVKTIGHNIVNGLRWGPDGWLYGRHGITDTSAVGAPGTPLEKRTKLNCAIWRYHPTKKIFEVVAHGGTNSWGHDWNENGDLFMINTVIGHLWHVIPGAYYRRMFGTHLNPHVYEIIEQTADHFHWDTGAESWSDIRKGISSKTLELGGGHAHVGMLIYQGNNWPKEYHGAVLTCNLHGNRINVDKLEREGCGYVGKHAPDFMKAKDKWFRGIDLLHCPDGNVIVSDWSDSGECHDNDGVHRSSGRIYKIIYKEADRGQNGQPYHAYAGFKKHVLGYDLTQLDKWDLESMNHERDDWWSRMAALELRSRGIEINSIVMSGSKDRSYILNRETWWGDKIQNIKQHLKYAEYDRADGPMRLGLASSLQRLPVEDRWGIATSLAKRAEDANDRQQPLMIWYGIEPSVAADPMKGVELIREAKIPTVRRLVARRIAEMIESKPEAVDALVTLIFKEAGAREDVLRGLAAGLDGFSTAKKPQGWDEVAKTIESDANEELRTLGRQLSVVFGSGRAAEELIVIVKNAEGDANARLNAFKSLTRTAKP